MALKNPDPGASQQNADYIAKLFDNDKDVLYNISKLTTETDSLVSFLKLLTSLQMPSDSKTLASFLRSQELKNSIATVQQLQAPVNRSEAILVESARLFIERLHNAVAKAKIPHVTNEVLTNIRAQTSAAHKILRDLEKVGWCEPEPSEPEHLAPTSASTCPTIVNRDLDEILLDLRNELSERKELKESQLKRIGFRHNDHYLKDKEPVVSMTVLKRRMSTGQENRRNVCTRSRLGSNQVRRKKELEEVLGSPLSSLHCIESKLLVERYISLDSSPATNCATIAAEIQEIEGSEASCRSNLVPARLERISKALTEGSAITRAVNDKLLASVPKTLESTRTGGESIQESDILHLQALAIFDHYQSFATCTQFCLRYITCGASSGVDESSVLSALRRWGDMYTKQEAVFVVLKERFQRSLAESLHIDKLREVRQFVQQPLLPELTRQDLMSEAQRLITAAIQARVNATEGTLVIEPSKIRGVDKYPQPVNVYVKTADVEIQKSATIGSRGELIVDHDRIELRCKREDDILLEVCPRNACGFTQARLMVADFANRPWMTTEGWYGGERPQYSYLPGVLHLDVEEHVRTVHAAVLFKKHKVVDEHISSSSKVVLHFPGIPLCAGDCRLEQYTISITVYGRRANKALRQQVELASLPMRRRRWKSRNGLVTLSFHEHNDAHRYVQRTRASLILVSFAKHVLVRRRQRLKECVAELQLLNVRFICTLQPRTVAEIKRLGAANQLKSTISVGDECISTSQVDLKLSLTSSHSPLGIKFPVSAASQPLCFALHMGKHILCSSSVTRASAFKASSAPTKLPLVEGLLVRQIKKLQLRILRARCSRASLDSLGLAHVELFSLACSVSLEGTEKKSSGAGRNARCEDVYEWPDGIFQFSALGDSCFDPMSVVKVVVMHREIEVGEVRFRLMDALEGEMKAGEWCSVGSAFKIFMKARVDYGIGLQSAGHVEISRAIWTPLELSSLVKTISASLSEKLVNEWIRKGCSTMNELTKKEETNSSLLNDASTVSALEIQRVFRGSHVRRELYQSLCCSSGTIEVHVHKVFGMGFDKLQKVYTRAVLLPSAVSQQGLPAWAAQGQCKFVNDLLKLQYHAAGAVSSKLLVELELSVLNVVNTNIATTRINCTDVLLTPNSWREHCVACTPQGKLCVKLRFSPNPVATSRNSSQAIYLSATFLPAKTASCYERKAARVEEHAAFKLVRRNSQEALEKLLDASDHETCIQLRSGNGLCLLSTAILANSVETANALVSRGYSWNGSPPPRNLRMAQCLGVLPSSTQLVTAESQKKALLEVLSHDATPARSFLTQLMLSSAARNDPPSRVVDTLIQNCAVEGVVTVTSICTFAEKRGIECSPEIAEQLLKSIAEEGGHVTAKAMRQYVEQAYSVRALNALHKLSRWTSGKSNPNTVEPDLAYLKAASKIPAVYQVDWDVLVGYGARRVVKRIKLYCPAEEVVIPIGADLPVLVNDIVLIKCREGKNVYQELARTLAAMRFTQKQGAVRIQSAYRRHCSKPASQQLKRKRTAAIRIQVFYRGKLRHRAVKYVYQERDTVATTQERKKRTTAQGELGSQRIAGSKYGELVSNKSPAELADILSLCLHLKQGLASEVVAKGLEVCKGPVSMQVELAKEGTYPAFGISIRREDIVTVEIDHLRASVTKRFQDSGVSDGAVLEEVEELLPTLHRACIAGNKNVVNQVLQQLATKRAATGDTEKVLDDMRRSIESLYVGADDSLEGLPWKCLRFLRKDESSSYCWTELKDQEESSEPELIPIDHNALENSKTNRSLIIARELVKTVNLFGFSSCFRRIGQVCCKEQPSLEDSRRLVLFETEFNGQLLRLEALLKEPTGSSWVRSVEMKQLVVSQGSHSRAIEISFGKPSQCSLSTSSWKEPSASDPFSIENRHGVHGVHDRSDEAGWYRVYWDGDIAIGDQWVPCRIIGRRPSDRPHGHLLLVKVDDTELGWMETLESKGKLRVFMQLDRDYCNALFATVCRQLDPDNADMSLRLSPLLRKLREAMVASHGTVEKAFAAFDGPRQSEEQLTQFLLDLHGSNVPETEGQGLDQEVFLFLARRLMTGTFRINLQIWLDVFKPEVEGDFYEICKELRLNDRLRHLEHVLEAKKSWDKCESWILEALVDCTERVQKDSLASVDEFFIGSHAETKEDVMNMLTNEVKFHFPGFEAIRASREDGESVESNNGGISPEDISYLPQQFFRQKRMVRVLKMLRSAVLGEESPPLRISQLRALFKRCGSSSAGDLRTHRFLKIDSLASVRDDLRHEKLRKLFFSYFESQPGVLSIDDFARLVGQHRLVTGVTKGTITVRWKVKWLDEETQRWCDAVIKKYRHEDEAVLLRDSSDNTQGFIKLTKRTFKFTNNQWSSKPWGRDILYKELEAIYK